MAWGLATLATLLLAPQLAAAKSTYLNGVKIDGLTNQEFKGATVKIDSAGNVHIEAKGYEVKRLGIPSAAAPVGPPVSDTYYLVATESNPGKIQWDVDVFIGGQLAGSVKWDEGQVLQDISSFLIQGENKVVFSAKRNLTKARKSFSPGDKLTVIIGTGSKQGNNVVISKTMATFVRTAAEDEPVDKEFTFTAR